MAVAEVERKPGTRRLEAATASLRASVHAVAACVREADGETLAEALIQIREAGIDPLEAVFATGVRRFDKSGSTRQTARCR
jgi:methylmalonyl-CoA mutase cobalamin-binding subunit